MRTQTKNGNTFHDYRNNMLQWGWNILHMEKTGKLTCDIMGIGLGIKENHIIVISDERNGNLALEVEEIKYDSNPRDLYNAKLKSIGYVEE
ncbi:hypothetical protein [Flagellimonas sp.]|uniref:hypothetical protein n=1 Tax=Flagellimonas sp. TaxID=2058762 RepID=UPI003F49C289